jgi:MarR family transcriptional regulator, organic hydroperoxide resistance regulator
MDGRKPQNQQRTAPNYHSICDPSHEDFSLSSSIFYLIAHADFQFHEDMDKVLSKYGVKRSTYRVLTVLREKETCNIGELSEGALLRRTTVSRIVKRMNEEGLVETTSNPADNRITEVRLRAAGKRALDKVIHVGSRQFNRATEGLSDEELGQLLGLLKHMIRNLSKLPIE